MGRHQEGRHQVTIVFQIPTQLLGHSKYLKQNHLIHKWKNGASLTHWGKVAIILQHHIFV